jgi:hypothetical protein
MREKTIQSDTPFRLERLVPALPYAAVIIGVYFLGTAPAHLFACRRRCRHHSAHISTGTVGHNQLQKRQGTNWLLVPADIQAIAARS